MTHSSKEHAISSLGSGTPTARTDMLLATPEITHLSYRVVSQMHTDGSTLVTNAALRRLPSVTQRHQYAYAFYCLELRSVENTAAPNDDSLALAVDATSISKEIPKLASVWITSVNLEQPPTQVGSRKSLRIWHKNETRTSVLTSRGAVGRFHRPPTGDSSMG